MDKILLLMNMKTITVIELISLFNNDSLHNGIFIVTTIGLDKACSKKLLFQKFFRLSFVKF